MDAFDLGALVLFAGANIRYVTGSYQGNWKYNISIRYVVLPRGGEPVFFETAGSDLHCAVIDLPWIPQENIRPAITWQWAEGAVPHMAKKMVEGVAGVLKEHKVDKEKIGVDNLDMPSLQALKGVNGAPQKKLGLRLPFFYSYRPRGAYLGRFAGSGKVILH
jgi:Xaa-Pro aminopeptidase